MLPTSIDAINTFLDTTEDVMEYKRAMAVKMVLLDFRPCDIALALDVTEAFVSKWKLLYFKGGIDAFAVKYQGSQGYLTSEQRQSVINSINVEKIWSVDALVDHIQTVYGVEFKSPQSYYTLLAEARVTWKRAQSQHPAKDPERIASKKKEIEGLLMKHRDRIIRGEMLVYFIDECHVLGDTAVGYGWAPSDQRVTVLVQDNHDRQTYFGALNMLTGSFVLADYPTANGDTTVAFLHKLRRQHPEKQILVLWDNASYHHKGDVVEFFADVNAFLVPDEWKVTAVRFAPYASEQNPVEHVWQIGKQYVRERFRSLRTFSEIKAAFEHIKNKAFTFADLSMYFPKNSENKQMI
jgi:transposase